MELFAIITCSFAAGALALWLVMRRPAQVPVSPVRPAQNVPQSSPCPKCKAAVYAGSPEQYREEFAGGFVKVVFHCPSCNMSFCRHFDTAS